jgi:hypothetical protein
VDHHVDHPQQARRRPTRQQLLAILGLAILVMVIGVYVFGWKWLIENTGFPGKTIWDWMELLIVPVAIAIVGIVGGALFTRERARDTALQTQFDHTAIAVQSAPHVAKPVPAEASS